MTTTPSHQAGNSRRDQLTSALVVGGVLVVLGAASGLGIAVSSAASPFSKLPGASALGGSTKTSSPSLTPVNYIGTPGPGNLPTIYPGGIVISTGQPSAPATPTATTSTVATTPTPSASASTPTPTGASTLPTLNCPSDVVTGLLDLLLGNKGQLSSSGLLKTVLNLLPNLASLLNGAGLKSVLTTNTSNLTTTQANSMAQACTPVLSGLLGGAS